MKETGLITDLLDNPWRNVYWFARMLINNDKYGGIGNDTKTLTAIAAQIRMVLASGQSEVEIVNISKNILQEVLTARYLKAKTKNDRIKLFIEDISKKIECLTDLQVLVLTIESVMIPINRALADVPSNDRDFTVATAKAYMDELGETGLATVINMWDDVGVQGCLSAERSVVVRSFAHLKRDISVFGETETDIILTAFVQEFERRLGQKRKSRAGGSLEDVASFIFDYYNIDSSQAPEHFQADIEVDKWVKCKDHWIIGISCKRTLRERWKQVSSADSGILSKYKIKGMWHLITFDEDLSDDKLTSLGSQRHVFYLRDDSRILQYARSHIGMKDYVRPMSSFIIDLRKEING